MKKIVRSWQGNIFFLNNEFYIVIKVCFTASRGIIEFFFYAIADVSIIDLSMIDDSNEILNVST